MTDIFNKIKIVLVTCPNQTEAETMAKEYLEQRLAACVNIIPQISSIYRWEGKIDHSQEVLMIIKSCENKIKELESLTQKMHSYDCPEFVVLEPTALSKLYQEWIIESCQ